MIKDYFEKAKGDKKETYYLNWDGMQYFVSKSIVENGDLKAEMLFKSQQEKDAKSFFDKLPRK